MKLLNIIIYNIMIFLNVFVIAMIFKATENNNIFIQFLILILIFLYLFRYVKKINSPIIKFKLIETKYKTTAYIYSQIVKITIVVAMIFLVLIGYVDIVLLILVVNLISNFILKRSILEYITLTKWEKNEIKI